MSDLVQAPKTAGYRPFVWADRLNYVIDGRPRFTWLEADRMRWDPQVQFALRILRAPLYGATWKVRASHPRIAQFVDGQMRLLWSRCVPKLVRFYEYGVAIGEVLYTRRAGRVEFDRLLEVHPRDARPLEWKAGRRIGQIAGVRVKSASATAGIGRAGTIELAAPHFLWFSGESEFGNPYGRPRMAGMYEPWLEKRGKGGAVEIRRHFFRKVSYRGGHLRFPIGTTDFGDENTGPIIKNNQDVAREIVEKFEAGGVLALPNTKDDTGDYAWAWEDATALADAAGVRDYPKDLDREILIGAGIPPELVEAATVGSGYSGRAIPAQMFFTSMDEVVSLFVGCFCRQVIDHLVRVNFGKQSYEVEPDSLARLVAREAEDAGQQPKEDASPGRSVSLGFDRLRRRVRRMAKKIELAFDESKVNRDHGEFSEKPGAKGEEKREKPKSIFHHEHTADLVADNARKLRGALNAAYHGKISGEKLQAYTSRWERVTERAIRERYRQSLAQMKTQLEADFGSEAAAGTDWTAVERAFGSTADKAAWLVHSMASYVADHAGEEDFHTEKLKLFRQRFDAEVDELRLELSRANGTIYDALQPLRDRLAGERKREFKLGRYFLGFDGGK